MSKENNLIDDFINSLLNTDAHREASAVAGNNRKIRESFRSFIRVVFVQNSCQPDLTVVSQTIDIGQPIELISQDNLVYHLIERGLNQRLI